MVTLVVVVVVVSVCLIQKTHRALENKQQLNESNV